MIKLSLKQKKKIIKLGIRFIYVSYSMLAGFWFAYSGMLIFFILGLLALFLNIENDPKEEKVKIKLERFKKED